MIVIIPAVILGRMIQAVPKGRYMVVQAARGCWDEARQQRRRRPAAGGRHRAP